MRTLKAFSSWLLDEEHTPINVLSRLRCPRLPQPMIEVLSDEEINAVIRTINSKTVLGGRLLVIVLLLLDTGMRASELCGLTLDNTHLQDGYAKAMGKGRKERIIPISANTQKALLRWINT